MGSTFEYLAVPRAAAELADLWVGEDREVDVPSTASSDWVLLQAWGWPDGPRLPPTVEDFEGHPFLWAACFDSDYAFIHGAAVDSSQSWWLLVNPESARDMIEGLWAISRAI